MSKMSVMLTCLTLAMTEGCQGFMRLNHPRHFSPLEVGALPQCRTYHKGGCCFGKATSCKPDSTEWLLHVACMQRIKARRFLHAAVPEGTVQPLKLGGFCSGNILYKSLRRLHPGTMMFPSTYRKNIPLHEQVRKSLYTFCIPMQASFCSCKAVVAVGFSIGVQTNFSARQQANMIKGNWACKLPSYGQM